MRLLANPAEAEDIAQEVFLKAYERFDESESRITNCAEFLRLILAVRISDGNDPNFLFFAQKGRIF